MLKTIQAIQRKIWLTFASVKLVITLLICLTVLSVAGTLIAQQGTTQVPLNQLYSPTALKWLVNFGLTDVFHSPVFIFLMLCLALNLLVCSIERLPKIWKQTFHVPPQPVEDPTLKSWDDEEAKKRKFFVVRFPETKDLSVREAKASALLLFQKYFGKAHTLRDSEDEFQVTIEKGKYSRLGVYITHLSLLLIMFGAVLGAIVGFEGGMTIDEGTRQSWMQHLRGSRGGMQLVRENGVPVPGFLNLGFEVECENFTLETYDGERPKAFRSKLNFYENDVKTASATIAVNHPFVYRGMTFYQASYAPIGMGGVDLKVYRDDPKNKKEGGVELVENVRLGELYRVDGDAAFKITQVEENLMELGPAARVHYFPTKEVKKPTEFWVFQKLPGFDFAHRKDSKLHFVLDKPRPKYATGISVASDPGVWVVWVGSAILILALFIALYTCHSRYWIAFVKGYGFVVVGWSNKLFLFEPRFEKFLNEFKKEFKL